MTIQELPFYDRVDHALHDDLLKTALNRATTRFIGNRTNAIGALSDEAALRDQARALRAHAWHTSMSYWFGWPMVLRLAGGRSAGLLMVLPHAATSLIWRVSVGCSVSSSPNRWPPRRSI